jgi:predicted MFS family arabinose efflux permease
VINEAYEPPGSYMRLGWVGVAMVFASLFFVWILKEAPIRQERAHGSEGARASWQRMVGILREDSRVRWVIAGRIFRSAGFLVGVYITAVFIERCGLDEEQMWMPVIMTTVPGAAAFLFSGWFVDHFGVRLASVFSGLLLCATSVALFWTYNVTAFIVLFAFLALATTLMASSWMPMLMKLAPEETRPAYVSTINLAAAPFTALFLVAGIIMVQYTGFEYIFAVPAVGGILSAAVFYFKLPHIH